MNTRTKALIEQARRLTPEERIQLVEDLLDSLEPTDPEIDRLWAEEARDCLDAYRWGEMGARPLDDVLEKFRRV
jgi:putative addiction module component (TIGR02574 family)